VGSLGGRQVNLQFVFTLDLVSFPNSPLVVFVSFSLTHFLVLAHESLGTGARHASPPAPDVGLRAQLHVDHATTFLRQFGASLTTGKKEKEIDVRKKGGPLPEVSLWESVLFVRRSI